MTFVVIVNEKPKKRFRSATDAAIPLARSAANSFARVYEERGQKS